MHPELPTINSDTPSMGYAPKLSPPDGEHVWWLSDIGALPGSDAPRSTFLLGHSWSKHQDVFNNLSLYAAAHAEGGLERTDSRGVKYGAIEFSPGLTATVETATGILTYALQQTDAEGSPTAVYVPKEQTGALDLMKTYRPDHLTIVTCMIELQPDGTIVDKDFNIVLSLKLVSSFPK